MRSLLDLLGSRIWSLTAGIALAGLVASEGLARRAGTRFDGEE